MKILTIRYNFIILWFSIIFSTYQVSKYYIKNVYNYSCAYNIFIYYWIHLYPFLYLYQNNIAYNLCFYYIDVFYLSMYPCIHVYTYLSLNRNHVNPFNVFSKFWRSEISWGKTKNCKKFRKFREISDIIKSVWPFVVYGVGV